MIMVQPVETSGIKRLYYSISEASHLVDEEQYVLRYWETEFEQLRPQKNRAGNRIYTEKDIELLRTIKHLLREKRYTVDGAKEHIRALYAPNTVAPAPNGSSNGVPNGTTSAQHHENGVISKTHDAPSLETAYHNTLSREELLAMRDTLRDVLHLLTLPPQASSTDTMQE
jgi:DNA-binding transcriptional MerR regulator